MNHVLSCWLGRCAIVLLVWMQCHSSGSGQEELPAQIVFERATDTNLGSVLRARRGLLEKRQGAKLTGHQWWLWGLGSFDYDQDGDLDLIVEVHGSTNGLIIKNLQKETGQLRFADATAELGVDGIVPATDDYPLVWDINGDGWLDIAGLLDDSKTPCLLTQEGQRFEKDPFSLHPINHPEALQDFNGDGYPDVRQTRGGNNITMLFDPARQDFQTSTSPELMPPDLPAPVTEEIARLRAQRNNRFFRIKFIACDLNGDRQTDLVIQGFGSYSGDRVGWYLLRDDAGKLAEAAEQLGLPREAAPVLAQDLDGDGDTDLLLASGKQAGLYLWDQGRYARQTGALTDFVSQRCPYLQRPFLADLDNDGDHDLAISNRRYHRQMVFENQGSGRFAKVLTAQGWDADPLVIRDVDDDGRLDLLIGGSEELEEIGIFLNRTPPTTGNGVQLTVRLEKPNLYAVGTEVQAYRAGTMNTPDEKLLFSGQPQPDGSPLAFGLGNSTAFDLRVSFPQRDPIELQNVRHRPRMLLTSDGQLR